MAGTALQEDNEDEGRGSKITCRIGDEGMGADELLECGLYQTSDQSMRTSHDRLAKTRRRRKQHCKCYAENEATKAGRARGSTSWDT